MKGNLKRAVRAIIIMTICTSIAFPIMADTLEDEKNNKKQLENQLSNVKSLISELEAYKSDVQTYITQLDSRVAQIQANIDSYNNQINEKQAQIDSMNAQIAELEQEYNEEYESMKLRICYMYENGSNQLFDTFFGSDNFGDMLNKYSYLEELVTYDQNQMKSMADTMNQIKTAQVQIQAEQDSIKELMVAQESEKSAVDELLAAKNTELKEYSGKIASVEEQEQRLENEIKQSQDKINALVNGYSGPAYSGGSLTFPLPYYDYISTWFGYREWDHSNHRGMDFAVAGGTPIYAAESGVVIVARGDAAYKYYDTGNYVVIYHGNGLYTEYMHCSAINVTTGQNVNAGDVIGWVGSTGYSTGNHLHFGVVVSYNGFTTAGRVDPAPYLGL